MNPFIENTSHFHPLYSRTVHRSHHDSSYFIHVLLFYCLHGIITIIALYNITQLGDPTAFGNLPPCPVALEAIESALHAKGHAAGYVNACGIPQARNAIAQFHNPNNKNANKASSSSAPADGAALSDHVVIANGCSGALELALTAILDPGSILLVPQPGFPLYQVIAESHGASVVHYRLLPDQNWECDLQHLEALVKEYHTQVVYDDGDETQTPVIRGILVNNPSNPTGGVFSRKHLEDLVQFAKKYQLPIVADEVYGDLVFRSNTFHPLANVADSLGREVPVITASGLAKQYLVPGWRVGWIVFQDK